METKDTISSCSETKNVLFKEDLKGTRTEHGFKRAFMSLFGQDDDTFTIKQFRETLLQHISNVKKSVAKRTRHQRQYDRRVNKRQMQTQENKVDLGKALDIDLVVTESSGTDTDDYTEQPEIINEGRVDQYTEKCQVKSPMLDSSLDNKTTEYSNQSLDSENICLKKTVAQFQKDFSRMEAHIIQEKVFAIAALKNELRKSKGNSVDTKQPTAFKSERPKISKPRFAFQVDVEKDLSKPVTQHYVPKEREYALAKPHHVIASSDSRNSYKNMPRFSSNDMVHNHNLEEAKKKTQEKDRNSKSSVMHSTRLQNTTNDSKPKPRSNNQTTRILHVSKSSCVTLNVVPLIFTGHSFTPNKSSAVYEKISPRSSLRWKPTGRIFDTVGFRWIPTGTLFDSCTSKADSKSTHGSNVDISKIRECKQTLDLSTGTSINVQKEQIFDLSASTYNNVKPDNLRVWLLKKLISYKPVLKWIQNRSEK
ncbi:hypothetical protein Tco_0121596 [Tanacetum coccineum]